MRDEQFLFENMVVVLVYVVSDWPYVSRIDNPISLQLTADFTVSNCRRKRPQSENDKIKPVSEMISFL